MKFRFPCVSQTLRATDMTSMQEKIHLLFITMYFRFVCKFSSPHNHSETSCFILHVDFSTRDTEIDEDFFLL